jgi:hypothetical protein
MSTSKQLSGGLGQQKITFVPHKAGKYVICASENKVAIDDTPFSVGFDSITFKERYL